MQKNFITEVLTLHQEVLGLILANATGQYLFGKW